MGISFMASSYKRWALPDRYHSIPKQSHLRHFSTLRGREALLESGRSTHRLILGGGEVNRDIPKSCSPGAIQKIEGISVYEDSSKINDVEFYSGTYNSSRPITMREDTSVYVSSLRSSSHLQFSLLMENLDKIEDILAGADLVRLERDILVRVGKLGALKLFRACLSRILMAPTDIYPDFLLTEHSNNYSTDFHVDKKKATSVVRTGKKEERRLRRLKASSKRCDKVEYSKAGLGGLKRSSKSRRRSLIARNESEMSKGAKEIAELEKNRSKLEEEIRRSASYARWAEATGIDQKTLKQRLQYGWYCRDELIKSSQSLVVYLAKNYRGMGIAFDDLLQAGKMGVLKGAERFDGTRGYRFSTYVRYWIRKSMLALLASHSKGIQIPVTMKRFIKRIQVARRDFYDEEGRYPQDYEIAELTGISLDNVRLARKCSRVWGSLDKEMVDGWRAKFMEVTIDASMKTPDETITREHMRKDIMLLLEVLEPREMQVLVLRYGLHDGRSKSLGEIAKLCCVTKEWIRKIEKSALTKIRSDDITRDLKCYINL